MEGQDRKTREPIENGQKERGAAAALLFISIISIIVLSTSVLIGSIYSIVFGPDLSVHWEYIVAMIGITIYVIVIEIIGHVYHRKVMFPLYLSSTILMGAFFYMFLTSLIAGIVLLPGLATGWNTSSIVINALKFIIIGGVFVPMLWGLVEGRILRTKHVSIPLKGYAGKGARIALISDVHIGLLVGKRRLGRILSIMESERPDIIVSAGDLLDTNPKFLQHIAPKLKEMTSMAPSYAVVGNHEFYHGLEDSKLFLKELGFKVLDNRIEKNMGTHLTMIGVDDPSTFNNYDSYRARIEELVTSAHSGPKILLNHQPIHFKKAAELGVSLMLSGHTHGGQMFPGGLLTRMIFKDGDRGLKRYNGSYLYVCIGSGSWGPPIRVGAPSELIIIDIEQIK
ncbi:MAG: metallophosphoesterase [Candidatus Thermoplasmatota archaeon]|nr:metallophosphoesterase [Candidatus Thermoplasmatota archaeon]